MNLTVIWQVLRRAVVRRLAVTVVAFTAVAFVVTAVPGAAGRAAAGQSPVPPLNTRALAEAIAGLPSSQQAAAVVTVTGRSGSWSGTSGLSCSTTPAASGPPTGP